MAKPALVISFYPVFARELRTEARCRARARRRSVAALYSTLAFALLLLADRWAGAFPFSTLTRGIALSPALAFIPVMLLIGGFNRAGQMLSEERSEGTLPLLLLTPLSGFDILLGKTLQAIVLQLGSFLVIVPALILPLLALGWAWGDLWRTGLACVNALFFGMALGLLGSVLGRGSRDMGWRFLLVLPFVVFSTPVGMFLPGAWSFRLHALDWINPCEPFGHLQMANAGLRPMRFWGPLIVSHATAWGCLLFGGWFLSRITAWRGSVDARSVRVKTGNASRRRLTWHSDAFRRRLLNRSPYLWLTSRDRWTTPKTWLLLALPSLFWGWASWILWAGKGCNLIYIMVAANSVGWFFALLVLISTEAGRQLTDDRLSRAAEMLVCTPLGLPGMVRGQWLALRRRYVGPVLAAMLVSCALMIIGYVTFGFGGMLDAEDQQLWLFWWVSGIVLLPLVAIALAWIAMRRALFAAQPRDAGIIAFVQGLFWPAILLGVLCDIVGGGIGCLAVMFAGYLVCLGMCARRARSALLADFRTRSGFLPDPPGPEHDFRVSCPGKSPCARCGRCSE